MWVPFEEGATVGQRGSEDGTIVLDLEHARGARLTVERDCPRGIPCAVTCGIYGWFFHTRFSATEFDAEVPAMLGALAEIIDMIPCVDDVAVDDRMSTARAAIQTFVACFL